MLFGVGYYCLQMVFSTFVLLEMEINPFVKGWLNSPYQLYNLEADLKGCLCRCYDVAFRIGTCHISSLIRFDQLYIQILRPFFFIDSEVYFLKWAVCYQVFGP